MTAACTFVFFRGVLYTSQFFFFFVFPFFLTLDVHSVSHEGKEPPHKHGEVLHGSRTASGFNTESQRTVTSGRPTEAEADRSVVFSARRHGPALCK